MSSEHESSRKPLLEKLERQSIHKPNRQNSAFHKEAKAWSKEGRDLLDTLIEIFRGFFEV